MQKPCSVITASAVSLPARACRGVALVEYTLPLALGLAMALGVFSSLDFPGLLQQWFLGSVNGAGGQVESLGMVETSAGTSMFRTGPCNGNGSGASQTCIFDRSGRFVMEYTADMHRIDGKESNNLTLELQ